MAFEISKAFWFLKFVCDLVFFSLSNNVEGLLLAPSFLRSHHDMLSSGLISTSIGHSGNSCPLTCSENLIISLMISIPLFSLFCLYGSFMIWISDLLDLPLIIFLILLLCEFFFPILSERFSSSETSIEIFIYVVIFQGLFFVH